MQSEVQLHLVKMAELVDNYNPEPEDILARDSVAESGEGAEASADSDLDPEFEVDCNGDDGLRFYGNRPLAKSTNRPLARSTNPQYKTTPTGTSSNMRRSHLFAKKTSQSVGSIPKKGSSLREKATSSQRSAKKKSPGQAVISHFSQRTLQAQTQAADDASSEDLLETPPTSPVVPMQQLESSIQSRSLLTDMNTSVGAIATIVTKLEKRLKNVEKELRAQKELNDTRPSVKVKVPLVVRVRAITYVCTYKIMFIIHPNFSLKFEKYIKALWMMKIMISLALVLMTGMFQLR